MPDNPFGARAQLDLPGGPATIYRLQALERAGLCRPDRLPYTVRVLLENALRAADGRGDPDVALRLAAWRPDGPSGAAAADIDFWPARVLLQDLTGVPLVVDLAALRQAVAERGGDPNWINPVVPVDLVIDHSVQVDAFGQRAAFGVNVQREYERNGERYALLRWAQSALRGFRVVPPGTGIVHQVNLEHLAAVVTVRSDGARRLAFPDTLIGTDSHTTMVNGAGVLGWGVGGIEAEAVMLGEAYGMKAPEVVGMRLDGRLPDGATATDLVLTVTQLLRAHGVVGKFVEFHGPGLGGLPLPDRATLANMAPEYGATCGFFPVDDQTLAYLRATGRDPEHVDLVERYCKEQGLYRTTGAPEPEYTADVRLDLGTVEPSIAGPSRPEDRLRLGEVRASFRSGFPAVTPPAAAGKAPPPAARVPSGAPSQPTATAGPPTPPYAAGGPGQGPRAGAADTRRPGHGAVAIAAITSCTNTSNPGVMVAAGLLAKRAVERGLRVPGYVKTSLAPGSRAVSEYLGAAGLLEPLEALGFAVVGYGCTTCIGNSGPLTEEAARAADEDGAALAAVLSGNRNFAGRIHAKVRANYLASPPLVIAYALAGTVDIDLEQEPLGTGKDGRPVRLRDLWPSAGEVAAAIAGVLGPQTFRRNYAHVFEGDARWRGLPVPTGLLFRWDESSTYIRRPPFCTAPDGAARPIRSARCLALLGDSITTDHISPAGEIAAESDAAAYLREHGLERSAFNTYGARRGNHEVMMRGTFANVRLRNQLAGGREGGWTVLLPEGAPMTIHEAAGRYAERGTPLVVIAGSDYGKGSSRDWAAKGPLLLGVRAVIARSFERIHRSNLIGMGVLPLQFAGGESAESLGLNGQEEYSLEWEGELAVGAPVRVTAGRRAGGTVRFEVRARLDTPAEVACLLRGGILPATLERVLDRGTRTA